MAIIDSLKNKNGDIIYPKTLEKAIYDNDGVRLDNKLTSKVDKEPGKSLIADSEIDRLSTVVNQTTLPADGGNADTVGGYSIVITTEELKGTDANTLYFCIEEE